MDDMDDSTPEKGLCRVCRTESIPEKPLFHPCMCKGSIKYIHQDCLEEWLSHSKNEYCELCNYKFSFAPVYAPDMPDQIPFIDIVGCISLNVFIRIETLAHIAFLILVWAFAIPYTIGRIYRSISNNNFQYIITLPFDMVLSINRTEELLEGIFVTYCIFVPCCGIAILYQHLKRFGGPGWIERDEPDPPVEVNNQNEQQPQARAAPLHQAPQQDAGEVRRRNGNREEILQYLGFDGSFTFLRNAGFVAFSSALFILIFSVFPYYMGSLAITVMALKDEVADSNFEALVTTLCGYCLIHMFLSIMYDVADFLGLKESRITIGICYIFVKALLLATVDIGILPFFFGWWLDVCSFPIFGKTKENRPDTHSLPGISIACHWVAGAVFMYCCTSSLLLIKDVVRPELLGFFKYLNRPDSRFINELLQKDMHYHGIRLITITIIFGLILSLIVWSPVHIIVYIWPEFFPFILSKDSYYNEYFFEILLLWTLLPEILYPNHTYIKLKMCVRIWCKIVSYLLGIKSYLVKIEGEPTPVPPPTNTRTTSNRRLRRGVPRNDNRPTETINIDLPLQALKVLVILSVVVISLAVLTIPVFLGRVVLSLGPGLFVNSQKSTDLYEPYTAICGFYICSVVITAINILMRWRVEGHTFIKPLLKFYLKIGFKATVGIIILFNIIPFLFGILLELVIVVPISVPLHQTPIMWLWKDLTVIMNYIKYVCFIILIGPTNPLKRALLRIIVNKYMNVHIRLIMRNVFMPVISVLSLCIAIPYMITSCIVQLFVNDQTTIMLIARNIYPIFTLFAILVLTIVTKLDKFKNLEENIRNDKYLLRRRLVNYTRKSSVNSQN